MSKKPISIRLPTINGDLRVSHYEEAGQECVVVRSEKISSVPFVRIHSSCLFSESFHSIDCDCARQLDAALEFIGKQGGVVIYLFQEGRGIGIKGKIEAILLEQEKELSTAEAFQELGYDADPRDFSISVSVIKRLGINEVILATNNPKKIKELECQDIVVKERVVLDIKTTREIDAYLTEKTKALGHYEKD